MEGLWCAGRRLHVSGPAPVRRPWRPPSPPCAAAPDALAAAGVDLDALVLACPTTAREAWDVLVALGRCGALDLLVLASLPGVLALPRAGWSMPRLDRQLPRLATALRGRVTAL